MAKPKGKVGSPSSTQPRFVIEDGESIEATADREVYRKKKSRHFNPTLPPKMVTVTLQMRHSINGIFYGPGTVTLTESKANAFLNTEHEAMAKETSLFQQQAFIIGFRNGVPVRREVPAQRFDDILAREELPIETMGGMR